MDELGTLKKKVARQELRIKKLEAAFYDDIYEDEVDTVEGAVVPIAKKSKVGKEASSVSFNQVITVLGILGISIGAISFFFYAIANGWIGKTAQVGMGVLAGFVLFAVAFSLRGKNRDWSNIVFGGAYFLEYLSIGVGVSIYRVIPASIGVLFGFLILVSSMVLTVKFSSRVIAYFSLVGGFLIPIITDTFESQFFVMIWYFLILAALSIISVSFNWVALRAVMLVLITLFMQSSFGGTGVALEFFFLGVYFVLFNFSSLVNAVSHEKELNFLDCLILGALPVIFLPLIYDMMNATSGKLFGLIVILFSFVYLMEAAYLKSKGDVFAVMKNALVSVGVLVLNIGVYFLFNEIMGLEFFMVFYIVQWMLFSYLSSVSKEDIYGKMSLLFLGMIAIWYFLVLRFNDTVGHASFFMVVLTMVPVVSFVYFKNNINYKANAATFIISGYLFIYSVVKYLAIFVDIDSFNQVVLSVLWLIYTLVLFVQVETGEGKTLVGILLGITLLKIAFKDLFLLPTGARIIGFILFGVLLLIGGYFLGNEKK